MLKIFFALMLAFYGHLSWANDWDPGEDSPHPDPGPHVTLNPQLEGIYEIKLTCDAGDGPCNPAYEDSIDRISVIDTRGYLGVWVTLASRKIGDFVDTFPAGKVGPANNQISGVPRTMGSGASHFSYFELEVDALSGAISGSLSDYKTMGTLHFKGRRLNQVGQLLESVPIEELALGKIVGTYRGSLANQPGRLLIKERQDHQVIGYFASDKQIGGAPVLSLQFSSGTWSPQLGLLRLTFQNPRFFAFGELAAVFRHRAENQVVLQGFEFSVFANADATFKKNG